MSTASLIIGLLGFGAVVGAVIILWLQANRHSEASTKNELYLTALLSALGLIFTVIFPPLGVLILLAAIGINVYVSAHEEEDSNHDWLLVATFLNVFGVIMATMSIYYTAITKLSTGVKISPMVIGIMVIGALMVMASAILSFYTGRKETDSAKKFDHYLAGAMSLGSLILTPVLFLINNFLAIFGFILAGAVLTYNFYIAGQERDDLGLHDSASASAWLSLGGITMFTLAIWYMGTAYGKPTLSKLRSGLTTVQIQPLPENRPILSPSLVGAVPSGIQAQLVRAQLTNMGFPAEDLAGLSLEQMIRLAAQNLPPPLPPRRPPLGAPLRPAPA